MFIRKNKDLRQYLFLLSVSDSGKYSRVSGAQIFQWCDHVQRGAMGNVAYVSHVIGFVIGLFFGARWNKKWMERFLFTLILLVIYIILYNYLKTVI